MIPYIKNGVNKRLLITISYPFNSLFEVYRVCIIVDFVVEIKMLKYKGSVMKENNQDLKTLFQICQNTQHYPYQVD